MRHFTRAIAALSVAAAVALYFWPVADPATQTTLRATALVVFAVGLWATAVWPEYFVAIAFLFLGAITAIAPPQVIFSGFTTSTLWLVFSGLIIAEAVRSSGVGERIAMRVLGRWTGSYAALVTGTMLVTMALCFLMPATVARILLMIPILHALCARVGFEAGSRGYNGIMLAMMVTSFQIGTTILPSNIPNLVLAGSAETLYGVHLRYLEYLKLHFPVLGAVKAFATVALVCWLFRDTPRPAAAEGEQRALTAAELRMLAILFASLALWATDFLHHVKPGWIGLGAAVACLLPRVDIIDINAFNDRIKLGPFFYIGAVLGVGALIAEAGVADALGVWLVGVLELRPGEEFRSYLLFGVLSTVAGLVTTNPGQPALLGPIAGELAAASGWSVEAVLLSYAIGYGTIILPYQVPPVIIGLAVARVPLRAAARLFGWQLALTAIVLLPLNFLWWRLLGYLPH
jgi:di/tricarboxylate transporter